MDLINAGIDTVTVTGATGNDTVTGGTGVSTITGGGGNDDTVTVVGATECAAGFHKNDIGLCVADTDLDCPEGYEPNDAGTECIPVVVIDDKKCPTGQVYDEELKKCVPIKTEECAPGFHRDNVTGLCVLDGEEPCPEGYSRDEATGKCIPIVTIVDKKCPTGQVYDEELKKCVPIETEECATGFHKDATGLCIPDDDDECKTGYEKVDGKCVPVCKEGYIRNLETGVCEKAEKECPAGQVKNAEGKCVPIVKPPPPPVNCQPGFEKVDGVCVPVCKTGYKRVNGVCKKIATDTATIPTSGFNAETETTSPIYAGAMDDFDLFATLEELLADNSDKTDKKKDSKKSKEKTKMATGGHLDDLLAEPMTVDDLLKLLR